MAEPLDLNKVQLVETILDHADYLNRAAAHRLADAILASDWGAEVRRQREALDLMAYTMRKRDTALLLARNSRTRNREARLVAEAEVRRQRDIIDTLREALGEA